MRRLTITLLAAFDALVAAAAGLVAVLAPLTVLWATTLGATHWEGLWPTSASIWQLGHRVPQEIALDPDSLIPMGIPEEASAFVISLAPLAFFAFTSWFAARSGVRAARAGAWLTGFVVGATVFALAAFAVEMTSSNAFAQSEATPAVFMPALAYAVPLLIGAVVGAWIEGDGGMIDALHDWVDSWSVDWAELPALIVRGVGAVLLGLLAISAVGLTAAVILRGGEVIALYQASGVDIMGAVTVALATLAYLPTLLMWSLAYIAGPGIVLGTGATVSPAATHVGVLPGLPPLGLVPESTTSWMLAVAVLPVLVGVFAGWIVRSRYAQVIGDSERFAPRVVMAALISAISAGIVSLAFLLASGSLGPGRMAEFGPQTGWATLALFGEVFVGAAIMILLPRGDDDEFDDYDDHGTALDEDDALADSDADAGESPDEWAFAGTDNETKPVPRAD